MTVAGELQRRMARGAAWMVLFKLVERSLGLVSTMVLARLLSPGDFGIVAMAMSFVVMAELLMAFGFDIAIIQSPNATEEHYHTAWTCNVLLGVLVTLLMLSLAQPAAAFYQRPDLMPVVATLAFGPAITGIENIGIVAFRKELDFRREFRFQVARKLIGVAIVIPLAVLWESYWALVVGLLMSRLGGTVISYLMHPFRPRLSLSQFPALFNFSRWLLLNNLIGFGKERSSDFFIGRMLGPAALGTYNLAYEFAHLPTTEIGAPINRALLPGFAKMITAGEVTSAYRNAVGLLALLALPAAATIFAVAPYLVPVLLGRKWLDAVPLMQALAFNGALLMFQSSMSNVLFGRGYAARATLTNASYVLLLIVSLALLVPRYGAVGAALAALLTTTVSTPLYLFQLRRSLGLGAKLFADAVFRPSVAAIAVALAVPRLLAADPSALHGRELVGWLAAGLVASVVIYVGVLFALWVACGRPDGAERLILAKLRAHAQRGVNAA